MLKAYSITITAQVDENGSITGFALS